jgi:hypothetical protein
LAFATHGFAFGHHLANDRDQTPVAGFLTKGEQPVCVLRPRSQRVSGFLAVVMHCPVAPCEIGTQIPLVKTIATRHARQADAVMAIIHLPVLCECENLGELLISPPGDIALDHRDALSAKQLQPEHALLSSFLMENA